MEELLKQYRWFSLLCLQTAITLQFFMLRHVDTWAVNFLGSDSYAAKILMFIVSSSALFMLVAQAPLYWYEYFGWKILNPKINIEGRWRYHVVYYKPETTLLRKEGQEKVANILSHIKDNHGQMWVEQGVYSIVVQEGVGYLGAGPTALMVAWKGTSVTITRQGTVGLYYSTNHGGVKFNGFDDLVVRIRDKRGRPIELFGHFWMIPEGTSFVLRGEVTYRREDTFLRGLTIAVAPAGGVGIASSAKPDAELGSAADGGA
jgi:hypothetical protein